MNYGYSCDVDKKDKRQTKWAKQRKKIGFDDTELADLDYTFALFIIPRLERFRKITNSYPSCFEKHKDWKDVLQKMIDAFIEMRDKDEIGSKDWNLKKIDEGLALFTKHFKDLWD